MEVSKTRIGRTAVIVLLTVALFVATGLLLVSGLPADAKITSGTTLIDNNIYSPVIFNAHDQPLRVSVSGRIVDTSGKPVPGVTVNTDKGQSAVTNANGVYSISNLDPDTYVITPVKTGYQFLPQSRQVTLPPNAFQQDFTAVPPPPTSTPTPTPDPYPSP